MDDVKSFQGGFLFFPFNCRYSVVFTSLHINTNMKIFVDGLFGKEAYYYVHSIVHSNCILMIFFFFGTQY